MSGKEILKNYKMQQVTFYPSTTLWFTNSKKGEHSTLCDGGVHEVGRELGYTYSWWFHRPLRRYATPPLT